MPHADARSKARPHHGERSSSDGFQPYIPAIRAAFGLRIDYGQVVKQYSRKQHNDHGASPSGAASATETSSPFPVFNLTAIGWIGVIDMNTALLGIHLGRVILEVGPSLDVFAVPLCADTGCRREHALAPAGHLAAVLLPVPTSRFVVGATAHLTYVRGSAWSGVSVGTALEGRYRW